MRISSAPCKPSTVCWGIAFSSEVGTGSREENASNKETSRRRHDRPDRRTKQKGRRKAGLFLKTLLKDVQLRLTSVLCDDRASPAVIHANRDQIDVLTNALGSEEHARRRRDEIDGPVLREDVIVLDAG